jgi:hypothetical protein
MSRVRTAQTAPARPADTAKDSYSMAAVFIFVSTSCRAAPLPASKTMRARAVPCDANGLVGFSNRRFGGGSGFGDLRDSRRQRWLDVCLRPRAGIGACADLVTPAVRYGKRDRRCEIALASLDLRGRRSERRAPSRCCLASRRRPHRCLPIGSEMASSRQRRGAADGDRLGWDACGDHRDR